MPNHVHLLVSTALLDIADIINHSGCTHKYPLADTLRLLKGSTARLCNIYLDRRGAFWHHESYDHYVRSDKELFKIINYIYWNPVKAGLIKDPAKWDFFYKNFMEF